MKAQKPFLFVHSNGPTHAHRRSEAVKANIRRHIMIDIGKARRKRPRNPPVDVLIEPESETENVYTTSKNISRVGRGQKTVVIRDGRQEHAAALRSAFWNQHPLAMLESQWGMDMFSAYAIAFIIEEGKIFAAQGQPGGGFWFPFAFRASNFLRHFKNALMSCDMFAAASHAPRKKFQMIALERSLGTVSCLQVILNGTDLDKILGTAVIRGIVACICYNLTISDYAQARIHFNGLERLIAARGGLEKVQDNDVRLMVFWVDITIALLYGSTPRFPQPFDLLPELTLPETSETVPLQLVRLAKRGEPGRYMSHVILCLRDICAVVPYLEAEMKIAGGRMWEHEEAIGLRLNPIAHRLLSLSQTTQPAAERSSLADALVLGQLLWIILLKRMCRAYPGFPVIYTLRLFPLLKNWRLWAGGGDLLPVHSWLLILGAIGCCGTDQEAMATDLLVKTVRRWKLGSWKEVMMCVRQMPWVSALDRPSEDLATRVFPS